MARAKSTNVLVRFPPETHEAVKAAAARLRLSFNTYVVLVTGGDASRTLAEPEHPVGVVAGDAGAVAIEHVAEQRRAVLGQTQHEPVRRGRSSKKDAYLRERKT